MTFREPTADERVASLFPTGGPYTDEATRAAGNAIAALVRYLGHATRHAEAMPYPATVDSLVWSLNTTVRGLDQLLRQVSDRLLGLASRADAYATTPTGQVMAMPVAQAAATQMDQAQSALRVAYEALTAAGGMTDRIGLNLPEEEDR